MSSKKSTAGRIAETGLGTGVLTGTGIGAAHAGLHTAVGTALTGACGVACAPVALAGGAVLGSMFLIAKLVEYGEEDNKRKK